jgi:hypothetical protein
VEFIHLAQVTVSRENGNGNSGSLNGIIYTRESQ